MIKMGASLHAMDKIMKHRLSPFAFEAHLIASPIAALPSIFAAVSLDRNSAIKSHASLLFSAPSQLL